MSLHAIGRINVPAYAAIVLLIWRCRQRLSRPCTVNFASLFLSLPARGRDGTEQVQLPASFFRASASPISTKADVTSGPPTRIRVGVFILFHS